jgi:hypothetical protein
LVRTARTNVAREQFCVWAEEFEEEAAILAREHARRGSRIQPVRRDNDALGLLLQIGHP